MNTQLSEELIKTLQTLDTPTVCNALELLIPKRRGYGFTLPNSCTRPELPPMVGYARTATIERRIHLTCPAKARSCLMAIANTLTEVRNRALR